MDKSFDPTAIEQRWYQYWEENGQFRPSGEGEPYTIMLPPPNVTGRLHMGHAFQDTIMDALTRYHRMAGYDTLWQPGTDHAGIATQMVVERQLAAEGIDRRDIGREKFLEHVWKWKAESGGTITGQMRRLGTSVDWEHERFTMDDGLSDAVARVFVQLHEEGLIYRGKRLVNWDPKLHTALSDLEVISEEENGSLWHLKYPLSDGSGHLTVATTRPETMLGDTAVAVHPDDERFAHLIGQTIDLPLTDRQIPIIADHYVDPEFGSGCVKITPAHDFNDYDIGKRHELPMINVLTDDAHMNDEVPEAYRGMERFAARKKVVADFEALGLLDRIEDHKLMVPRGDRSGVIVEPYLTDQWYVKVEPLAEPAIDAVTSGRIKFVPENWSKTYFEWMNNIQDWCISRQLWWGHRIPAWYDDDGNIYVGLNETDARARAGLDGSVALRQDEDVLDTWFSSGLWPFSTLGWPEQTDRLKTYYPGSVLVTGFDIIFFWVARMIMFGLKFMGDVPFREVYIHGLIRDAQGQKMSKSKGNVLDPIDLIDGIELEPLVEKRTKGLMQPQMAAKIEKATRKEFADGIKGYGTDALRFTFAALATTGRDIRFDLGRVEGYRNYCNKIWNAARFVLGNTEGFVAPEQPHADVIAAQRWIKSALDKLITDVRGYMESYRFDFASQALYEFTWNEYCDWFIELTKPVMNGDDEAAKASVQATLLEVLDTLLRLHHPIMPFITEEIWQQLRGPLRIEATSIVGSDFPSAAGRTDEQAEAEINWLKEALLGIRRIRAEMNISPGKPLPLITTGGTEQEQAWLDAHRQDLKFVGRIESFEAVAHEDDAPEAAVALAGSTKLLIPLAGLIDKEAELERLNREVDKKQTEQKRLTGKLSNDKFVNNAPAAVVDKEREKLAECERVLAELAHQLERLKTL